MYQLQSSVRSEWVICEITDALEVKLIASCSTMVAAQAALRLLQS